jgi:hypothetical protein
MVQLSPRRHPIQLRSPSDATYQLPGPSRLGESGRNLPNPVELPSVEDIVGALPSRSTGINLGSAGSAASAGRAPVGLTGAKQIVAEEAAKYGWNAGQMWDAINNIVTKESSWNPASQNPKSTAYGLFQFLNGTWAGTGVPKSADPRQQAIAGLKYIQGRYGDPAKAWDFWQKHRWY